MLFLITFLILVLTDNVYAEGDTAVGMLLLAMVEVLLELTLVFMAIT